MIARTKQSPSTSRRQKAFDKIGSFQYPTGEPLTDEEEGEMERLAQDIGSEHPWAPEMVIEDRGPR